MSKLKELKEIVNNNEDSEFSADSSQSYDSDMSPENISRPICSENRKKTTSLRTKVSHAHIEKLEEVASSYTC